MDQQNNNIKIQNLKSVWIIFIVVIITTLIIGGGIYVLQKYNTSIIQRGLQIKIDNFKIQLSREEQINNELQQKIKKLENQITQTKTNTSTKQDNKYSILLEDLIQIRGQGGKRRDEFINNLKITSEKNAKVIERRSDQGYFLIDNLSTGFEIYDNGTKIGEINIDTNQDWKNNLISILGGVEIIEFQTYLNEKNGFEFFYPKFSDIQDKKIFIKEKGNEIQICINLYEDNDHFCHSLKYFEKPQKEKAINFIKKNIFNKQEKEFCVVENAGKIIKNDKGEFDIYQVKEIDENGNIFNIGMEGNCTSYLYQTFIYDRDHSQIFFTYSIGHASFMGSFFTFHDLLKSIRFK